MVDAGEEVSATLKREFSEEAMGSLDAEGSQLETIRYEVNKAFREGGQEVSCAYSLFSSFEC